MAEPGVVADPPARVPAIAQAPSSCRLCGVELDGPETWRAHAKSDAHVHKLRLKVAEPRGRAESPPRSE
ncbi:hypothetical protein CDD83_9389 [Cordyceps sp. RAO-2017]|nr:hypothetical protein CDD83_9389 [Cordyceps sp. RAO-2017]